MEILFISKILGHDKWSMFIDPSYLVLFVILNDTVAAIALVGRHEIVAFGKWVFEITHSSQIKDLSNEVLRRDDHI